MNELQHLQHTELTERQRRVLDGDLTRTDHAVSWIGWHIGELAAVGVPLVLAAALTWWLAVLSVLAGAVWVGREVRRKRSAHAHRPEPQLSAVPDHDDETTKGASA